MNFPAVAPKARPLLPKPSRLVEQLVVGIDRDPGAYLDGDMAEVRPLKLR